MQATLPARVARPAANANDERTHLPHSVGRGTTQRRHQRPHPRPNRWPRRLQRPIDPRLNPAQPRRRIRMGRRTDPRPLPRIRGRIHRRRIRPRRTATHPPPPAPAPQRSAYGWGTGAQLAWWATRHQLQKPLITILAAAIALATAAIAWPLGALSRASLILLGLATLYGAVAATTVAAHLITLRRWARRRLARWVLHRRCLPAGAPRRRGVGAQ